MDDESKQLLEVTRRALDAGIAAAVPGNHIGDIGAAVQAVVEGAGFSVMRDLVGHGIGTEFHEEPQVPNYGKPKRVMKLTPGLTIAIEPMVNVGTREDAHDAGSMDGGDGGRIARRARPSRPKRPAPFIDVIEAEPQGVKWRSREEKPQDLLSLYVGTSTAPRSRWPSGWAGAWSGPSTGAPAPTKRGQAPARGGSLRRCGGLPSHAGGRLVAANHPGGRSRKVRSRLLSPREAARLMGLPEDYRLPERYNHAYHVCGDGVSAPVVR